MKRSIFLLAILLIIILASSVAYSTDTNFQPADQLIKVQGKYFVKEDGTPFFMMGDTAWALATKVTTTAEIKMYLEDRAKKGFNTIIVHAIPLNAGNNKTCPAPDSMQQRGYSPFTGGIKNGAYLTDERYWKNLDQIVEEARKVGIYVIIQPFWGDYLTSGCGRGCGGGLRPDMFGATTYTINYGKFLGARYKNSPNIIWLIGGDLRPEYQVGKCGTVLQYIAAGIQSGDGGKHIITFHPAGKRSSSALPNQSLINFNCIQTGHNVNERNYNWVINDYTKQKPTVDCEPGYEQICNNLSDCTNRITDYDTRKFAYWAVFSGAAGHVYGANGVFQFLYSGEKDTAFGSTKTWTQAINLPGSTQVPLIKKLIESRPQLTRIPDQTLITTNSYLSGGYIVATRDINGTYAMIYAPIGGQLQINLAKINATKIKTYYFNPKDGNLISNGEMTNPKTTKIFTTPTTGNANDWVLIIDDAAKNYPLPGQTSPPVQIPPAITCSSAAQCGTNGTVGNPFCSGNDIYETYRTYTCNNPDTNQSTCTFADTNQLKLTCASGQICSTGTCSTISCYTDSDCEDSTPLTTDKCTNPSTIQSLCTHTPLSTESYLWSVTPTFANAIFGGVECNVTTKRICPPELGWEGNTVTYLFFVPSTPKIESATLEFYVNNRNTGGTSDVILQISSGSNKYALTTTYPNTTINRTGLYKISINPNTLALGKFNYIKLFGTNVKYGKGVITPNFKISSIALKQTTSAPATISGSFLQLLQENNWILENKTPVIIITIIISIIIGSLIAKLAMSSKKSE